MTASTAARCEAIIHAWQGYSYDSSRPEGVQAQVNEARNRMSIKSQNYVGAEMNPAFSALLFTVDEDIWRGDLPMTVRPEISETFSMLMGL